jgi:predicted anti-sigma-YlaC factor YlaD
MRRVSSQHGCERVRTQLSVLLDGGLSQLERRMVSAHLERCADCRTFEETVAAFTRELRAAPLAQPLHPIVVRRPPRRVPVLARPLAVAATMAIAILGVVSQVEPPAAQHTSTAPLVKPPTQFGTARQLEREMAQIGAFEHRRSPGPMAAL